MTTKATASISEAPSGKSGSHGDPRTAAKPSIAVTENARLKIVTATADQ